MSVGGTPNSQGQVSEVSFVDGSGIREKAMVQSIKTTVKLFLWPLVKFILRGEDGDDQMNYSEKMDTICGLMLRECRMMGEDGRRDWWSTYRGFIRDTVKQHRGNVTGSSETAFHGELMVLWAMIGTGMQV